MLAACGSPFFSLYLHSILREMDFKPQNDCPQTPCPGELFGRRRHWKYTSHITRAVGNPSEGSIRLVCILLLAKPLDGLDHNLASLAFLTRQWDGWDGSWWWENMKEGFVCGLKKVVFLLNAMWLKGMWFDWINRNMIVIKMWFCQKITQVQLQACFAEIVFPCVLHGQLFDTNTADRWRQPLCHVTFCRAKHVRFIQGQMRASVRAEQDQKSRWTHKHMAHLGDPQSEVPGNIDPQQSSVWKRLIISSYQISHWIHSEETLQ